MIVVPMDDRCRCPNPFHKGPKDYNGQCLQKATHESKAGVKLCADCVDVHLSGDAKEMK